MQEPKKLLVIIVLVILGLTFLYGGKLLMDTRKVKDQEHLRANVYTLTGAGRKLVKTFKLSERQKEVYNYDGPLGITVVEVDGLRARVKSSPCPDHVCVQFGWLSLPNDFSACLPNAMLLLIEDGKTIAN